MRSTRASSGRSSRAAPTPRAARRRRTSPDACSTPATLLEDAPLEIAVAGGLYRPRNYDETFRGPVSARVALAASLNVPAVRVLTLLGAETFVDALRRLGFGLDQPGDWYGPALALGSADVTLW